MAIATPTPSRHFAAICPHSGGLQAREFEAAAATLREAHQALWAQCIGSRYVREIYEQIEGKWVKVWEEGQTLDEEKPA
jgi:hypothetical protein